MMALKERNRVKMTDRVVDANRADIELSEELELVKQLGLVAVHIQLLLLVARLRIRER